ncbi:MAG: cadherin-like beta sandwich domain-containing protein, partial [Clostridiales bacterium]|nr:cadherin-like beta sandwich domain-containing protein [Clostridiales bacterium]
YTTLSEGEPSEGEGGGGGGFPHPTSRNLRKGPNGRTVTIGSTYPDSPSGLMPTPIENSFVPTPGNATPTLEIPKYRRYRGATEWISITFGGPSFGTTTAPNYLSSPQSWNNVKENYNTGNANGAVTYSQLSNIEFSGAELAGVDIQWGSAATSVLPNSFDPWTYDYTVKVQPGTESITVVPTSMSTKVKSIKLNGSEVAYRSSNAVVVEDGKAFTIDVTAPDGATESHYTFTMSVAVDLATVPAPAADNSESNQLPLTGYFKASLPAPNAGREIRYYIPDTAIQRPYFHFIAVPNGVNADNFIVASGWKQIADETGECLFVLMPKDGVWGTVADEKAYIAAARAYHQGGGANFFTTFGLYYLTGYKEGAAPLEAWAADNTNLVIAQSYVGSAGASTAALNAAGATSFGWMQMTDGDQRTDDRFVIENGVRVKQKILSQMTARLASFLNPGITGYEGLLTKGDMPVPTWLVNASNGDSLTYWKKVNKATGAAADSTITSFGGVAVTAGDVFAQKEDAWPTEYAGQISKVTSISASADTGTYAFSKALRDAMAKYTRYDSSITYGNALTYRLDYTAVQVERFSSKDKYATGKVSGLTLDGQNVEAEVTLSLFKTARGVADALLYVPETAGGKDIPVVIVNHGGSQNAHLYLDSTAWWQTAAKEGFALVLTTRTTQGTGGIAPDNLTLFDATINYLKADGRFDMTRIYTTGQSAGGTLTVTYAQDRADQLAAAYSTASGTPNSEFGGKAIPVGHAAGEGNYANRAIPGYAADTSYPSDETTGLVRSTAAAAAGADIYWDNAVATPGRTTGIHRWMAYFTDANGLGANALSSTVRYHGASTLNGGINNPDGRLADWQNNNARFRSFNWKNDYGIPVMEYTLSLFEAHNDLQGFRPFIWDFMKHYRVVENGDGTVTRYYSESAFADDDAVIIFPDILRFSVGAAAESDIARDVEFTLSASNAKNLLSVEVEFVVDGDMLAGKGIEPMNGFTLIDDVFWSYAGGSQWKGTATLAFPAGSSEGLMSAASVDIAKFVFAARAAGDATLQLTSVRAAGLVEPVTQYLDAIIEQGTATTNIDQRVFSKYDLNRDNKVDALDLGIMLLYCGFDKDSPNWDTLVKVNDSKGKGVTASMCDVNSDGVIDMLDLLDLFIHYTK